MGPQGGSGAYRPVAPSRLKGGSYKGAGNGVSVVAGAVAVCALAAIVLGFFYTTRWRDISFTVNGEAQSARIGTPISEFLESKGYFGARPGRLLSVGGNVLDEQGGTRATVTVEDREVSAPDLARTPVPEEGSITVADGTDQTEPHTEERVAVSPGVEMKAGGAIQYVSQWGKAGEKVVWKGERSGEAVDHEVVREAQNMVVESVNPKPQGSKKYMALTFDDGPSKYTQKILDILKEKDAKATFYNLGQQAQAKPELTKAVVEGGNELASHTNRHQNLPTLGRDDLRNEISSAFDSLNEAAGQRPQMIRAPYGAFTSKEWARSGDLISCNVLWNIDTLDWKRPGSKAITDQVLGNARNGAIALMHDGGGNREQDIEALPGIIDGLKDAGYELVTVQELMRLDGSFPEDVVNGTVKMPKDAVLPEV